MQRLTLFLASTLLIVGAAISNATEVVPSSAAAVVPSSAAVVTVSTVPKAVEGQVFGDYVYRKPGLFDFIRKTPGDLADYGKGTFRKKNTLAISLMIVGTGLLIVGDQWIVDRAYEVGDFLHISHSNNQRSFASIKVPLTELKFQGPYDSGSALYYLGDGWVDLWIAGGFLGYGSVKTDYRAIQTSSQIFESILTSGFVVQVLKHVTGRESPFVATRDGGRWKFFPDQMEYHQHVPHYDAFPTGHLAAAMATVTVIAENYPEHPYVRPVGYTLMTLLGFQMLNNGVHWVSDYPLGIALGYSFGKLAVRKGRAAKPPAADQANYWTIVPTVLSDAPGIKAQYRFN